MASTTATCSEPPTAPHVSHGLPPIDLVFVRHGRSEGNEAQSRAKKGDLSGYAVEGFAAKHSSLYRLTDRGRQEAQAAGAWIKKNITTHFDRYYTSEYTRAMETAALLDLPGAVWRTEVLLRERDKGVLDNTSIVEQRAKYAAELERRARDCFFWSPQSGESLAHVLQRIDHTYNTLRRELSGKQVVIVCHGEVMWVFRSRIEKIMQRDFTKLYLSKDPKDLIHNGQVIWYSRRNPHTGEIGPDLRWMFSICPANPTESRNEWMEIPSTSLSNDVLLQIVESVPRYINDPEPAVESTTPSATVPSKGTPSEEVETPKVEAPKSGTTSESTLSLY
ncbi:phosphoglycerate mutase family protein [Pelomyxa schiedti]|nr:phosphoglycerate mutase family protein [Pelomyxa schiedti]